MPTSGPTSRCRTGAHRCPSPHIRTHARTHRCAPSPRMHARTHRCAPSPHIRTRTHARTGAHRPHTYAHTHARTHRCAPPPRRNAFSPHPPLPRVLPSCRNAGPTATCVGAASPACCRVPARDRLPPLPLPRLSLPLSSSLLYLSPLFAPSRLSPSLASPSSLTSPSSLPPLPPLPPLSSPPPLPRSCMPRCRPGRAAWPRDRPSLFSLPPSLSLLYLSPLFAPGTRRAARAHRVPPQSPQRSTPRRITASSRGTRP